MEATGAEAAAEAAGAGVPAGAEAEVGAQGRTRKVLLLRAHVMSLAAGVVHAQLQVLSTARAVGASRQTGLLKLATINPVFALALGVSHQTEWTQRPHSVLTTNTHACIIDERERCGPKVQFYFCFWTSMPFLRRADSSCERFFHLSSTTGIFASA